MTAWEQDTRPSRPCVVCFGVPDRTVRLPRVPGVHRVFGSVALCAACAAAAQANDVAELVRRAERGWRDESYDPETIVDVVAVVVAAFGHTPPPKEAAPPEFRDPGPAPLSADDEAIWRRLEPLIYDGPGHDVVIRGRINYESGDERMTWLVHRAGDRVRMADETGSPAFITDGTTTWRAGEDGMMISRVGRNYVAGNGADLAFWRPREEIELFGFGRPIGPIERTEYLGRPAWRFAFAAPPHKPFDMHVAVDAVTGVVLEKRFGDHSLARWLDFVTDEAVDPALFGWDGPVISAADRRASDLDEHERDMARRAAWFAENVTADPLMYAGRPLDVLVHELRADGSFEASLDGAVEGALARRPRSARWWNLGWSEVTSRWSDDSWDWALSVWPDIDEPVDPADLAALRRALG